MCVPRPPACPSCSRSPWPVLLTRPPPRAFTPKAPSPTLSLYRQTPGSPQLSPRAASLTLTLCFPFRACGLTCISLHLVPVFLIGSLLLPLPPDREGRWGTPRPTLSLMLQTPQPASPAQLRPAAPLSLACVFPPPSVPSPRRRGALLEQGLCFSFSVPSAWREVGTRAVD